MRQKRKKEKKKPPSDGESESCRGFADADRVGFGPNKAAAGLIALMSSSSISTNGLVAKALLPIAQVSSGPLPVHPQPHDPPATLPTQLLIGVAIPMES